MALRSSLSLLVVPLLALGAGCLRTPTPLVLDDVDGADATGADLGDADDGDTGAEVEPELDAPEPVETVETVETVGPDGDAVGDANDVDSLSTPEAVETVEVPDAPGEVETPDAPDGPDAPDDVDEVVEVDGGDDVDDVGPDSDGASACPVGNGGSSLGLVDTLEAADRRVLANARYALTLREASGWMPSGLVLGGGSGAELIYGGAGSRERWAGLLLFDEAASHEDPTAPTTLESGPAMVHLRKNGVGPLPLTSELVAYADGRIHMSHRLVVTRDDLTSHWLVAYLAIPIAAVSEVVIGAEPPASDETLALPSGAVTAGSFRFLGGSDGLDLGARPWLCARDPGTGDALGWVDYERSGREAAVARVTESAAGAGAVHSVRLQYDLRRNTVPPATYTAEQLLVVGADGTCQEIGRVAAAFREPATLAVTGGQLVTGPPGDVDADGFVETLGHHRVSASGRTLGLRASRAVPGLALRVQSSSFEVGTLRVFVDGVERCSGDGFLAQAASGQPAGGLVLVLGEVPADVEVLLTW